MVTYNYLQAVIKETLRLFPALGVNLPRLVPKRGLTLAGRTFPEGVRSIQAIAPDQLCITNMMFSDYRWRECLGCARQHFRLRSRRRHLST